MIKMLSSAAVLAALMAPAVLSAQNERFSPVPRYDLMQLSVSEAETPASEFQAKTEALGSCADARKLAKTLGADTKRNRFISATSLPEGLRDELKDLQTGEATKVFSDDGQTLRVIVLCYRD